MRSTRPIRRRARALSTPVGVLLACAIALPQALARSSEGVVPAAAAAKAASPVAAPAATAGSSFANASAAAERGVPAPGSRFFRRIASHTALKLRLVAALRRLPPVAVRRVIAAGDRIARAPYSYGGGHGNWDAGAYDCSGSVSYALHGGGLLDTALASGALMSWGEPGPGRWITIYANPGHAFMVVAGRRFDTTGRDQTGSRWQAAMRDTSGYAVRHPPGL
jgi:cell wall-associated NlpC family hydrolase